MPEFGWVAGGDYPPPEWDLRARGWRLCHGHDGTRAECRHVLLCDTRDLTAPQRHAMASADRPAWRLLMLGVEVPAERGELLRLGVAEALPATTGLHELSVRAQRVQDMFGMLPRWRNVGPLVLDLFHRDARNGSRWLGLLPREFGLIWRLADTPGERVTRRQLLKDVWRIDFEPETNSVEVHVSRLRAKLALEDCASLIETATGGGYRLVQADSFMFPPARQSQADALDLYLRDLHASELRRQDS